MKRPSRVRRWLRTGLRVALLVALLYLAAGFLTQRLSPGPPLAKPEVDFLLVERPAAASAAETVVRGVLSVHSGRSHDAEGTMTEVATAARRADLDFVVLGDHPEVWTEAPDAFDPLRMEGVLLVPGVEMVVAGRGRVLAVGLDTVPKRWEAPLDHLLQRVDTTFGFVSVVHPRSPRSRERWGDQDARGIHAWESFDVSEMARVRLEERWGFYHLVNFLAGLPVGRADEVVVGLWREGSSTPAILAYDSIRRAGPMVLTGGLNHHPKARVAGGLFPAYGPFFRTVVNHVTLPEPPADDPIRAREQLMRALRAGSLHVSLGHPDRVGGFRFWVESEGVPTGSQGALLTVASDVELRLLARVPDAAPGRVHVRFVRGAGDDVWVEAGAGETVSLPATAGVTRVEIHHAGSRVPGVGRLNARPWILSNPIEIRPADASRASDDRTADPQP